MNQVSHIPMVRLVIPLLAGIIIYNHLEYNIAPEMAGIILAGFVLIAILTEKFFQQNYSYRFAFGLNISLFLLIFGYLLAQSRIEKNDPFHFSQFSLENAKLRLQITEPVAEKTNSWQVIGRATHIINNDSLAKAKGRLIIWLEKDSLAASLNYGDIIYITHEYQQVSAPQNPNAFNFKRFLARQHIYHQAYRKSGQWYATGENEGNLLLRSAHQMRQKALKTLEANNISGREFSVASALLLGYREYLDEDLQREFAGAGAMHILCVSGLHVGIIFLVLNFIFGFLKRIPHGYYIKTLIIIVLIWFYAAITGFSPSVLRASTMFSFVAVGQSFSRNTNIYNTLAASALILVLIDPFIVTRIGFQLSYIAVISIVWLQPVFYRQLYFKNKILAAAWGIITVSLAAQLGTGPLSLLYFNQFPNYFLITNLIVIPLTGFIIKTGIFFFLVSPISILSFLAGKVLSLLVLILHSSVRFIEGLPAAVSQNIFIPLHEALMIFALIITAGFFFFTYNKKLVFMFLLLFMSIAISISYRTIQNSYQHRLVIYNVSNQSVIDFYSGTHCYLLACQRSLEYPSSLDFHVSENRLKAGVKPGRVKVFDTKHENNSSHIFREESFIGFGKLTLKIVDYTPEIREAGVKLYPDTLDILIISQNPRTSIQTLKQLYPARQIVLDSSNRFGNTRKWMQECDSIGVSCWSVREMGAFELALK